MIKTDSSAAQLLFTTVRIVSQLQNGDVSTGTAFFFSYTVGDDLFMPVLVTNKHVVNGSQSVNFLVHVCDDSGQVLDKSFSITLTGEGNKWIYHPDDIDLCIMPCVPLFQAVEQAGYKIYWRAFNETQIPSQEILDDLSPIEEITMFGYPMGLWDEKNNFPLIRRGITSSHPALDFNSRSMAAIDIAAFPGSSGSPILIANEGVYYSKGMTIAGTRLLFLGLLFAGPQYDARGQMQIVDVPTKVTTEVHSMIPMHLGFYVKSKELLSMKNLIFNVIKDYKSN